MRLRSINGISKMRRTSASSSDSSASSFSSSLPERAGYSGLEGLLDDRFQRVPRRLACLQARLLLLRKLAAAAGTVHLFEPGNLAGARIDGERKQTRPRSGRRWFLLV